MQKEILEGVPYWKDKSDILYNFELDKKNLIAIGSYKDNKVVLKDNWEEIYSSKLVSFRENLQNRERKENKLK
jgi:hypothetical protein